MRASHLLVPPRQELVQSSAAAASSGDAASAAPRELEDVQLFGGGGLPRSQSRSPIAIRVSLANGRSALTVVRRRRCRRRCHACVELETVSRDLISLARGEFTPLCFFPQLVWKNYIQG